MIRAVLRKSIIFIAVMSTGLFAGFTSFFAFSFGPGILEMPLNPFLEFYLNADEIFDFKVLLCYCFMLGSTGIWLWLWRKRYRMVDFYLVLGGFLCVAQEVVLSYFGHYKINALLRTYAKKAIFSSELYGLREEYAYFMYFHFLTNFVAFILCMTALYRATSGKEPTRKSTLALHTKKSIQRSQT